MTKTFTISLVFAHSSAQRTLFPTFKHTFQKVLSIAELKCGKVCLCKDMILWRFLCRDSMTSF